MSDLDSLLLHPIEEDWKTFLRHMEWRGSFGLFFIFGSSPVLVEAYFQELDEMLRDQLGSIERLAPSSSDMTKAALEVLNWLHYYPKDAAYRSPIWLDLNQDDDPAWLDTRANLLARLNEKRELLRKKVSGSFIVLLPKNYRTMLRQIAPDLWSIRIYSLELAA